MGKRLKKLTAAKSQKEQPPHLTEREWQAVEAQIAALYPALPAKFLEMDLTVVDRRHCYLTLFRLSVKEIAILLHINSDSATKQRNRLGHSLDLPHNASELYRYLVNIWE